MPRVSVDQPGMKNIFCTQLARATEKQIAPWTVTFDLVFFGWQVRY